MARPTSLFFFFLGLVFILATCRAKSVHHVKKQKPAAFFIFGDSFLDAGNNNYINTTTLDQSNFWPYGETFFKFPTGRFSDGRLISDFIAQYAGLPLIPPFLQPGIHQYYHGVNFASAGAGALVETFKGDVINLETQLSYYKKVVSWLRDKLGNDEGKMILSKAVYLFSIGSNDYTSPFLTNSTILNSFSESRYVGMVIGNLTTILKEIYKSGGRKFAFINLPPLGCFPTIRILKPETNGSCLGKVSSLAKLHNKALSKLLYNLEKQSKGFKYSLFDLHSRLRKRMKHPSKYGFKEGEAACCGTGQFRGVFSCGGKRIVKEFKLCHAYRSLSKNHVALFIFGDSLFDAGNNNYINTTIQFQANFWPYGETFFNYPTGRASDGRLIPDFIAAYAKLPSISTILPSYNSDKFIYGVNFASAGGGALVETFQGMVITSKLS
ncbi:hypothetical protein Pint_29341 [Pistacia integerrima]|uniref:Uncharacterized protein n=1 Tax=Pistacia integerrima TaxID=434235 RepID=A0ACC0X3K3_9ROSI|nr:hypothetical protein Pint_29341 [Pistacia integerrima]